jgi:hypothetical protein
MKVLKYLSYSFLLIISSFAACTSEEQTVDPSLLYGHWDIKSAQRDGQPTETLTSTFFEFKEEGKMITNFNIEGTEISGNFEIKGLNITQKGDPDINYSIEKLEEGKLVLITKLMDYSFTLNLKKKD